MSTVLVLGEVRIDLELGVVERDGRGLILAPKEVEVLAYLARHPNQDVHRDVLYTEVWGYRPNVVSRTLDTTIRRLRTKIEQNPSEPDHLRAVHGFGYRLVIPDVEPTRWVGRASELVAIARLARQGPVLVVGAPGMGATTLAQQWADQVPGGARWIDGDVGADALIAELGRPGPLVVDHLCGLPPALMRAVDRRDLADPLLLTGHDARGWRWSVFAVPPMTDADAVALGLREWSRAGGTGPAPTEALTELARAVDAVPVAVIAVARAAATLGAETVLEQIRRPSAGLAVPLCARLREDFSRTWEHLGPAGRSALVLASTFGSCTPGRVLVEALGSSGDDPAGTLADLAARGLLIAGDPEAVRVPWHVRVCAAWFGDPEQKAEAVGRRDAWAIATAHRVVSGLERLELPDRQLASPLLGAWDDRAGFAPDDLWALTRARVALVETHGPLSLASVILDQAIEALDGRDDRVGALLLLERAARRQHFTAPEVSSDVDRALALARRAGDRLQEVRALGLRAVHLQAIGRSAEADASLVEARASAGCPRTLGAVRYAEGIVAHHRGDLEQAVLALRAAHDAAVLDGEPIRVRDTLAKLAVVWVDAHRIGEAAAALEQCLMLGPAVGREAAMLFGLQAQVALVRGPMDEAERAYGRALLAAGRCDCPDAHAAAAIGLATSQLALGRDDDALQSASVAIESYRRHRSAIWLGLARATLALVHHATGDLEAASATYEQALRTLDPVDTRHADLCLPLLALAEAGRGEDPEPALARYRTRAARRVDPLSSAMYLEVMRLLGRGVEAAVIPPPFREIFDRLPRP